MQALSSSSLSVLKLRIAAFLEQTTVQMLDQSRKFNPHQPVIALNSNNYNENYGDYLDIDVIG